MTIEELTSKFGKIAFNGAEYVLIEDAYIGGSNNNPEYTANAIIPSNGADEDGLYTVYTLTWFPLQSWLDGDREDEGDACDWNNPDRIDTISASYDPERDWII